MKTKYTKKQIMESIKHWQKVLESTCDIKEIESPGVIYNIEFAWTGYQNGDVIAFIAPHDNVSQAIDYEYERIEDAWTDDEDADWDRISKDLDQLKADIMKNLDDIYDNDKPFERTIDFGNETVLIVTVSAVSHASYAYFCI